MPKAKVTLDVNREFIKLIPTNVDAEIKATTVFGNKYVAFSSPKNPQAQRIKSSDVIDVSAVTTEFNTLFETVVSVAQKVDPVKLNETLTATAQALDGLGNAVRAVDRERQRDPGRPQPADATDPPGQPAGWPIWPTSTPTTRPTCSTGWSTPSPRRARSTSSRATSTRR